MSLRRGAGAPLLAAYVLFTVAAGARAAVQIATHFDRAPVAYVLSALAALVYAVNAVGLARGGRRLVTATAALELVGVVAVGTASLLLPESFPDDTVWSRFGSGYGFVPLVLPVLALLYLRREARLSR